MISHKIQLFCVLFTPLVAYIYAKHEDMDKNLKKVPDPYPWNDGKGSKYHLCGYGGDRCEKLGRCKTKGYSPVCCSNICRCMMDASPFEDKGIWCGVCETTHDLKRIKVGKTCRNATREEFNCWKKHPDKIKSKQHQAK